MESQRGSRSQAPVFYPDSAMISRRYITIPTLLAVLIPVLIAAKGRLTGAPEEFQGIVEVQDLEGMAFIPGGAYEPLFASITDTGSVAVEPFYLDTHPVTNAEYLKFVRANPEWRRSRAKRIFVDDQYLKHWAGDLDFGPDSLANKPVVNVSWFAAMAYAEWMGKRLPTTAEWELAASAGASTPDGKDDPAYRERILNWYSAAGMGSLADVGSTPRNYWGVYDLHGLVWEWVEDFNSALVTGESRNNSDLDLKLFCGTGSVGASQFDDYTAFVRFAFRSGLEGNYTVPNLGFRCARDASVGSATTQKS